MHRSNLLMRSLDDLGAVPLDPDRQAFCAAVWPTIRRQIAPACRQYPWLADEIESVAQFTLVLAAARTDRVSDKYLAVRVRGAVTDVLRAHLRPSGRFVPFSALTPEPGRPERGEADLRRPAPALEPEARGTLIAARPPKTPAERVDDRELVERLLRQLPEPQQTTFRLYVLEERTAQEIAELLGKSKVAIWSRVTKAYARLCALAQVQCPELFAPGAVPVPSLRAWRGNGTARRGASAPVPDPAQEGA